MNININVLQVEDSFSNKKYIQGRHGDPLTDVFEIGMTTIHLSFSSRERMGRRVSVYSRFSPVPEIRLGLTGEAGLAK